MLLFAFPGPPLFKVCIVAALVGHEINLAEPEQHVEGGRNRVQTVERPRLVPRSGTYTRSRWEVRGRWASR